VAKRITYTTGLVGHDDRVEAVPAARRTITVEVHDEDAAPWGVDTPLRLIGTDVPRVDGPAKATGAARFTYDVQPAGLAFAGLVTSPHAHARVGKVDVARAQALPGVLAVRAFPDQLATFPGTIVAAVCAASEEALDDALHAVTVAYEVLPAAVTVEDAMAEGAPTVDRRAPNVPPEDDARSRMRRGDPDGAWDAAEIKVEATYRTAIQTHSCLEPHGCVVQVTPDGTATVWASTQATSFFASSPAMMQALGVPASKVRVVTEHMGGGFGSKFGALEWDVIAAAFARETGRPVRMMLSRRLEHLLGGNRPDAIQAMGLGGSRDGTFTVLRGDVLGTAGNGAGGAGANNVMVYDLGAIDMRQRAVRTHTARAAAFRAPRHPQGAFALEGIIDRFARAAGLDPLAVRKKNDPHPIRRIQWDLAAERMDWAGRRQRGPQTGPWRRGVGCAAARWSNAGRGDWQVDVRVHADGHVTVMSGVQDLGTGTRTLLAILVAEELGLPIERVEARVGDTDFPPGPGSGGSTTAPSIGPAAREAALRAREAVAAKLASEWGVPVGEITWAPDAYVAGDRRATFADAARLVGAEGLAVSGRRRENWEGPYGETAGCQMAAVAVDIETGVIRVEHVVAVHDAGRLVSALTSRSQVNGGVIQGLSFALHEERQLDRRHGDMVNPTLDTYRILGMADCPTIDVVLTSVVSGFNNAGIMGLGEPATVATAAAVANAVHDAIGVQVTELPMTPARVLAALEGAAR
jgi:xanthine dehydrogenase YagR molybdenum-binding subunit